VVWEGKAGEGNPILPCRERNTREGAATDEGTTNDSCCKSIVA
jgi:hypothetical protein